MPYLALYRKYRPNSFEEMVGQENVIKVIKNAIINNKISHAYLFSGPRGTGKTTTAKIIAKMVNCLNLVDGVPCGKCENCKKVSFSNDIVEIDAASNNGVDEIREIREKVNLVPAELKYKIYIVDEVHMLTTQAFNALLKTLEEPPKHVIFILATTEFYKIPLTIVSRCQKFQFSKIDEDSMVNNLKRIAVNEKISVSDDVLYEISRLSDGCCRDAINLFDQLISSSSKNITIEQLYDISGSVSFYDYSILIDYVMNNDYLNIIKYCNKVNDDGKSIFKFVEEFILFIRDIISYKYGVNNIKINDKLEIIKKFSDILSFDFLYELIDGLNDLLNKLKLSSYPSILLSVFLLKISQNMSKVLNEDNTKSFDFIEKSKGKIVNEHKEYICKNVDVKSKNVKLTDDEIDICINNTFALASKDNLNEFKEKWENIDDYLVDSLYSSISGTIRDCDPVVAAKEYLVVKAKYDSLVNRFNDAHDEVEKFLEDLFGYHINVVAISEKRWLIEKEKYINNIKNGVKYDVKVRNVKKSRVNVKENNQSDLDILKDLVGNDIIECVK